MATSRGVKPKAEYPVCVRHGLPRKDVRLRHCFLCDPCAGLWTTAAFGGNASLWDSQPITGYCLLCNTHTSVRLRTWFLCDICWRVAASIGRNHVAEKAVLEWWKQHIEPQHPHLKIEQNDPSALRPRRKTDTSGQSPIDFLVRDAHRDRPVLAIENKTGRSAIREMSAFQLDVSDCDCIMHDVQKYKVPAYLIHAQVLEIWQPPTVGFKVAGLWWTDIYLMSESFRDVRMRRDEQRGAAFYKKSAFHEIDELPRALFDKKGDLALLKRFRREGAPNLYVAS
jgi:hypothetical protein